MCALPQPFLTHPADPAGQPQPTPPALLVLDTNAVLDAWVFCNPSMQPVLQALQKNLLRWVACPAMREELVHTLRLPTLQAWAADDGQVLAHFDRWATLAPDPVRTPVRGLWCSDNDDQVFMDLALAHQARWLLTQDRALLRLARKARPLGVHIVQPQRWRFEFAV